MLYNRNWHITVNQQYSNKSNILKKCTYKIGISAIITKNMKLQRKIWPPIKVMKPDSNSYYNQTEKEIVLQIKKKKKWDLLKTWLWLILGRLLSSQSRWKRGCQREAAAVIQNNHDVSWMLEMKELTRGSHSSRTAYPILTWPPGFSFYFNVKLRPTGSPSTAPMLFTVWIWSTA